VPWRVSPSSAGSGYLALMFLDGAGKEVRRDKLPLEPGWVPLGAATTAVDGGFALRPRAPAVDRVKLSYAGNDKLRGATEIAPYSGGH
jgi:hypothetical protein